jgi:hypothetical protein
VSFLAEIWAVIVSAALTWFERLDNASLDKIVSLLTILVISIGLADWTFRKFRNRAEKKEKRRNDIISAIEGIPKPFKAVDMLENPMGTGEKIGSTIEKITERFKQMKIKKFFKWIWYNKEQLGAILYNVAAIALANFVMFTDSLNGIFGIAEIPLWAKIAVCVVSVLFTTLTVRDVVCKYGLSSLDTINEHLAHKAIQKENKLTSEQKAQYKSYIEILKKEITTAKTSLDTLKAELANLVERYNADASLVPNFANIKSELEAKIRTEQLSYDKINAKFNTYKDILSGKIFAPKQ